MGDFWSRYWKALNGFTPPSCSIIHPSAGNTQNSLEVKKDAQIKSINKEEGEHNRKSATSLILFEEVKFTWNTVWLHSQLVTAVQAIDTLFSVGGYNIWWRCRISKCNKDIHGNCKETCNSYHQWWVVFVTVIRLYRQKSHF